MVIVGVYREYDMKVGILKLNEFHAKLFGSSFRIDTNLLAAERTAERVGWWGYIKESSDI